MTGAIRPTERVYVVFGMEGVISDGARECCAASGTAIYNAGLANEFLVEQVEPNPTAWREALTHPWVDLWMVGRPLVRKAGEYLALHWITKNRPDVLEAVRTSPLNPEVYKPLLDLFKEKDTEFQESGLWARHDKSPDPKDPKDTTDSLSFYKGGRNYLGEIDLRGWYDLTKPFPGMVQALRALARTRVFGAKGQFISGFQPVFGTSKDEQTVFLQCKAWANDPELMTPDEVELLPGDGCIIAPYHIMGKRTIPKRGKVEQSLAIAQFANAQHANVFVVNDQYTEDELTGLADAGFVSFFLEDGYAFPIEKVEMRKQEAERRVRCVTRENLISVLGEVAQRRGLCYSGSYPVNPILVEEDLIPPWASEERYREKLLSLAGSSEK